MFKNDRQRGCLLAALLCLSLTAHAQEGAASPDPANGMDSRWQQVWDTVSTTWNEGQDELYVPLHTWHNRRMYTPEKIAEYNENPWGLGVGKYRYDEQGNWHALYAMAFLDSHSKIEPIAGYGYEKNWRPAENWRLGAGFTVGMTARQDYHYYPIPVVLPMVSIEYKRFALQSAYVPGSKGNGNVLFTWARWQF